MDPIKKQLRQRLELDQMLGVTHLPRRGRLSRSAPEPGQAESSPSAPAQAESSPSQAESAPVAASPSANPSPVQSSTSQQVEPMAAAKKTVEPVEQELAALEQEIRDRGGCCGLCAERTNLVFGEGCPRAELVFVGEAPGRDEDAQGRPFVGRAGQKLNEIITNGMGLRREDVYIANVCKCRPPNNRQPMPDEMAACLPYLKRQLELIGPKVVVALGATAAQGLLETTESVGSLRGRTHQVQIGQGPPTPVIVTYHPAYLLRNYTPDTRRKVWADIQEAMKIAGIAIPKRK